MIEHSTREQAAAQADADSWPPLALHADEAVMSREIADGLTRLVRMAMGRLGGVVEPWLDEGMLIGQGLVALVGALRDDPNVAGSRDALVGRVVESLRRWARMSTWYRAAWPCRVAPLCASLASRPGACDDLLAGDLGLREAGLRRRFVEAGLVFGVSPELIVPASGEGGDRLAEAIAALPRDQRSLLVLYFRDGLTIPEIAELLELPPDGTQELYGRATATVRTRLVTGARERPSTEAA